MSRTTKWRGRSLDIVFDRSSPRRPSCSPISSPSSPSYNHHISHADLDQNDDPHTRGLGLSGTSLSYQASEAIYPDHLYIDRNGGAHVVGAKSRSSNGYPKRDGRQAGGRVATRESKPTKRKNHTRSGSTIDDLANAAIATSPRFGAVSPRGAYGSSTFPMNSTRPATSHVHNHVLDGSGFDRPSKRIKSDKLTSAEWTQLDQRPRTSHASDYQSPRPEEAELLLGLRYAWGAQASPPAPNAILHVSKLREPVQPPADLEKKEHDPPIIPDQHTEKMVDVQPGMAELHEALGSTTRPQEDSHNDAWHEGGEQPVAVPLPHQPSTPFTAHTDHPQSAEKKIPSDVEAGKASPTSTPLENVEEAPKVEMKSLAQPNKKPRKIQPQVQAEVCASCLKLQLDGGDEENTTQWIGCEFCKKWFHAACVGFKDKLQARSVDKYYCTDCEGAHGTTTFVRKSSRARTAIDYAGLNEGLVKPSDNSTMHHYIQPIKDGRIKYIPDDFARVRPELMTAAFWENMDGMKRPFVVPACWNPRFGHPPNAEDASIDLMDAIPMSAEHDRYFDSGGSEIESIPRIKSRATEGNAVDSAQEIVADTDQDYLDMVMPRDLTVRTVAELYGPEQPVPVIDVKSQETKGQFTLGDWADYYEQQGDKPIRNVISLEVSSSRLGRLIRRPKVVRDIDLEDYVWDNDSRSTSNKRPVQFYCLMSVADSYTDFHIDFGGSSVYYHILKGVKTFFFIPPEDKYLKKYEEWCNSDTQNDTWLGDLCGGNVTRVDLYEGDTAFIPAGWIHSVWTPQDSLVIGGNFLTRFDYELQLKVANIEKTTRVPLKFRYPFFQKVMWYALLKYLDEDPVPEEVLRDFHDDEEYRYLRANPAWVQFDDEPNLAEPGEPGFNARTYPKSELKGLPALRDYLYRTARIHADLPVADINKRQIDAVKASIPKGHGDPMQLIKTFAVWCAWKIGNEKVPDWVHTDFGGLLPELKEREKSRKAEQFRVPPERVSARKAKESQIALSAPESTSPDTQKVQTSDSDDSAKKQIDSKSAGTRLACEACRKRRIKCRHREGDVSPSSTSPATIRPRAYSNISIDLPKLITTSPTVNSCDQTPRANGTSVSDFNNTDIAQAALATLHSQASEPTPIVANMTPISSAKKGRSKACEECRKSKRRCVHDEYGRVDPAKAAEPSKPRGSSSAKRPARISDDYSTKQPKGEFEIEPSLSTLPIHEISDAMVEPAQVALPRQEITDAMIDPALMGDRVGGTVFTDAYETPFFSLPLEKTKVSQSPMMNGDPSNQFLNGITDHAYERSPPSSAVASPAREPDKAFSTPSGKLHPRQSPVRDNSFSPITVDGALTDPSDEPTEPIAAREEPSTTSRQASRTPQQTNNHMPEDIHSPSKTISKSTKANRRASSETSGHTSSSALQSGRSSSNTSGTTHHAAIPAILKQSTVQEPSGSPPSRDSIAGIEVDADVKLARELQAAENGLRRRGSVRV